MSIASEISRLQSAKADIKTAIEGKGVTVPSATTLDGYADLVDAIQQGGGDDPFLVEEVEYVATIDHSTYDKGGQLSVFFEEFLPNAVAGEWVEIFVLSISNNSVTDNLRARFALVYFNINQPTAYTYNVIIYRGDNQPRYLSYPSDGIDFHYSIGTKVNVRHYRFYHI